MLSQSQSAFLTILRNYLNYQPTVLPSEFDEAELAAIAYQQQCEGIVYHQTRLPSLQQNAALTAYCAVHRRKLLQEIHDAFTANGIRYLLFKGSEIARYYPIPELRSMGDSDILVRQADRKRADEVLRSLDFSGDTDSDHEWHYRKNDLDFELHFRLLYDETVNLPELIAWTDTIWEHASSDDGIRYEMEPEFHFVYLLIHLRKHLMNSGVGFRQFMDVAVMAQQELKRDTVGKYLAELRLTGFAENCFAFCGQWFGIALPTNREIPEAFYHEVTDKVFAGGVFGFEDPSNTGNVINYQFQTKSRIRVFFEYIFLSYSYLRKLQAFSFLDGKPWLLPVAWVYRCFRILKEGRMKSAVQRMLDPLVTEVIDGRAEYLKNWGL